VDIYDDNYVVYFINIEGVYRVGLSMGRPVRPHLKLWGGPSPTVPLSLRPCMPYLSITPIGTQPVGVQCFFLRLVNPMSWCFLSSFSVPVSLDFFMFSVNYRSIHTLSLDPLFLTPGLGLALVYPLACGPRGGVGLLLRCARNRNFDPNFCPVEPRPSRLAVQYVTARQPRTPIGFRCAVLVSY